MGLPASTFADPQGEPDTIDVAAAQLGTLAGDLDAVAAELAGQVPDAGQWSGLTADAARASAEGTVGAIRRAAGAIAPSETALRTWAGHLRQAKTSMRQLRDRHDEECDRHARAVQNLQQQAALAVQGPGSPGTLLAPPLGPPPTVAEDFQHASALTALRQAAEEIRDQLDDRALECRRALEETFSAFVRGHRESLDDYLQGVGAELLTQIPGLSQHAETVESAVWALMTGPQALLVFQQLLRRSPALYRYFTAGEPLLASRFTLAQQFLLQRLGLASWLDPASAAGRAWLGTQRTANLASVFAGAARGQGMSGLLSGARATAAAGGAGRLLGAGGAAAATAYSVANLAAQGNPIEAFQENGTEYLADVAEVGFNGSLTAFMVAPNPWTGGAVVVTGVAWGALEVWNHREDIANLAQDGLDMVGDGFRATTDAVSDVAAGAVDTGRRVLDGALDTAGDVASALNPFD